MLNILELVQSTKGKLINGNKDIIPKNYVIDSRLISNDDFFVPIIGENCVKNNICGYFISSAFKEKEQIIQQSLKINKEIIIIEVEDTLKALVAAATFNRQKHIDIPIVAVTGSVGKTSTRQIIASVLATEKNVLVTEKNYNTNFGISIMCLKMDSQDVCVLEAGIDKFNEMDELSSILKPDIACFTIIGTSHIGTLKTRENIFKEKFKLTNNLKGLNKIIINNDDDMLCNIDDSKFSVIKISEKNISNLKTNNGNITYNTKIYNENVNLTLNQIGIHNAKNSLFAIKVGEIFNISKENIIKGISSYINFNNRLNYERINEIQIVDDTYNASLESIKSGIETILNIDSNKKILVLGDILDLGDKSYETHVNIGTYLKALNVDLILLSGEAMKDAYDIIKSSLNAVYFENKDDIVNYLISFTQKNDIVYFKASNGMNYTELINKFKENVYK